MNRTTHDLAEDVAATFVRRQYTVRDEKCGGAGVVSDDPQSQDPYSGDGLGPRGPIGQDAGQVMMTAVRG